MAQKYTAPKYSREEVDAAGVVVATADPNADAAQWENALAVIGNWRASHAYPQLALRMTLAHRARRVDARGVIAQRLKRLSSIEAKLKRLRSLRLSEVQDIGGCRSILRTNKLVRDLIHVYDAARAKSPHRGPELLWVNDYILEPKRSGYRSYHLIYEYRTTAKRRQMHTGQRIEIQLRSRLQHAWATAVETVDAFTSQSLKSNFGSRDWKRFFALMGSAVAFEEGTALVPGTPTSRSELFEEIRDVEQIVRATTVLRQFRVATNFTGDRAALDRAAAFLLKLDTSAGQLFITPYRAEQLERASERYLALEKETAGDPAVQVVLVSTETLANLKKAYPNYFVDLELFVEMVDNAINQPSPVP